MNMYIEKFLSPISKQIWSLLDYPEEWAFDNSDPYYIVHRKTKVALWGCNGRRFLDGHKTLVYLDETKKEMFVSLAPSIGKIDRHILWYKVKKVIKYNSRAINSEMIKLLTDYNNMR